MIHVSMDLGGTLHWVTATSVSLSDKKTIIKNRIKQMMDVSRVGSLEKSSH